MIDSLEEAGNLFKSILKSNDFHIVSERMGIGEFIKAEKNGVIFNYCVCFKREYYKNFQYHFPALGKVGWGQIANKDLLKECEESDYAYVIVMPDEKIYVIKAGFWLDYYDKFKTDVPHLKGEIAIPMKFLKKFES